MSRKIFIIFLVIAVFAVVAMSGIAPPPPPPKKRPPPQPPKCGPNEVWTNCGSACEASCKNPAPPRCNKMCVPKCQCRKGLVRNKVGKCIDPCDC